MCSLWATLVRNGIYADFWRPLTVLLSHFRSQFLTFFCPLSSISSAVSLLNVLCPDFYFLHFSGISLTSNIYVFNQFDKIQSRFHWWCKHFYPLDTAPVHARTGITLYTDVADLIDSAFSIQPSINGVHHLQFLPCHIYGHSPQNATGVHSPWTGMKIYHLSCQICLLYRFSCNSMPL